MRIIKKIYGLILLCIQKTIGADCAKKFDSFLRFRRKLNLKHPETLADKVCFIELHQQSPLAPACTAKFEVREYIRSKGFGDILVPLAGGPWSDPEDIDFSSVPVPCIFKGTHGCKMNYSMTDRSAFDISACKKEMNRWLRTTYGLYSVEPHYRSIPHRIYAEAYLGDQAGLIDYKFHCMNGSPVFVLAVRDRKSDGDKKMQETRELYDTEWNPIPGLNSTQTKIEDYRIEKPANYDRMLSIAEEVSKDFDFVRVDLYNLDGKIYFGELTFTPTAGVFSSYTEEFLREMGDRLMIQTENR